MKIYCFSGLGADTRVFKYLSLNYEIVPVNWIKPIQNESISDYSVRLSKVINPEDDFGLLGVSFGGFIATEISKRLKPKVTILISSAETRDELSPFLKLMGRIGLFNIIPQRFIMPPKIITHRMFGTSRKSLLNSIIKDTDLEFAKWAVGALVNWNNKTPLKSVLKISGSDDRMIPPGRSNNVNIITGGGHFIIVDRANEVSIIINRYISKLYTNQIASDKNSEI
ncbi:MAG: alpha/beta hydrolase [Bacteroidales bacterium]|jgi:pimeloyl-ACP methyl ester carboxylesterase|nr:alpha/beta hydrolase [Bacteroidales bacterium]